MLVEIYSIPQLLSMPTIKYHKGNLAKVLGIYRATVTKYENDTSNESHMIIKVDGKFRFFVGPRTKENKNEKA